MKRSIFATHSTIRNTLFFLLAILIALFVYLKNGISIDHLKIASLSIDGLYLKLDKKIILKAEKIMIPRSKKKQVLPDLEKGLDLFNEILRYFEYIELKEVNFKNDHYSILYSDNIFYMVNDLFEIATHKISREGNEVHAIIDLVYIKQFDIRLSGKFVYNYKRDTALVKGEANYLDIHANFLVNKRKKNLYYAIESGEFTQLKPLIDQFKIPPKISVWITDKVRAGSYRINYFKGSAKINKSGIRLKPATMTGEAFAKDVSVDFKKGIDPVRIEKLKIIFKDENLYFEPYHPYFNKKALNGSRVAIVNLFSRKNVLLKLDLKFNSRLDNEILEIVKAYKIDLPLFQESGSTVSGLKIDVNLKTKKVDYAFDFKPRMSEITIGSMTLPVVSGDIHTESGITRLSNVLLKNDIYKIVVSGTIDPAKKLADLNVDVKSLYLGEKKKPFLLIKKSQFPMKISFKSDIIITLPTMKMKLKIPQNDTSKVLHIADITLLKKYLKYLPISVDGGSLKISSSDFKRYTFEGILQRNDCIVYKSESSCLTRIPVSGTYSENGFVMKAFGGNFVYDADRSLITLRNLNLDLEKFFSTIGKDSKSGIGQKLRISATNSILRYGKSKLVTDRYDLGILPGGDFHFRGKLGKDRVKVTKRGEKLEIVADRISDRMLYPLIRFSGLQKGSYSLNMSGVPGKMMTGVITVDNGVMSDFKAYNNLLAFINTIPALATFRTPGFSSKGFAIKHGVIKFTLYRGKLLTFDSVLIEGKSATVSGDGTVDLVTKKIDIDLAIQTAKQAGKIIGSLPLVGYILTGKNKSIMTVGLHIGGTLDKPVTKVSPIKDILLLPFRMLERTFHPQAASR